MIVTISEKTNKPLCWNINLDLKYNIWSLCFLLKKNFFFSLTIRMNGKNVNFRDKKVKKGDFYKNKK